jgi:hypothetical protein
MGTVHAWADVATETHAPAMGVVHVASVKTSTDTKPKAGATIIVAELEINPSGRIV